MSDAGSKTSFATIRRGLPRTLWQKGAIFSTRISRASVSAGKHVPQYYNNMYTGGVVGHPDRMSQHQSMPFNMTQGTQGFYQQKYEQMAQKINDDINQNYMHQH